MKTEGSFRMTPQRRVLLESLREVDSHPTADELYEKVREKLPRVSLGTVYRNLELLSSRGLIRKIEHGGAQKRFDGDLSDHCHIRCSRCGRVDDVPKGLVPELGEVLSVLARVDWSARTEAGGSSRGGAGLMDYEIHGHRLELVGICPECSGRSGMPEVRAGRVVD